MTTESHGRVPGKPGFPRCLRSSLPTSSGSLPSSWGVMEPRVFNPKELPSREETWAFRGTGEPTAVHKASVSSQTPPPWAPQPAPGILAASQCLCSGRNLPSLVPLRQSPAPAPTPPFLAPDHAPGRWQATQPPGEVTVGDEEDTWVFTSALPDSCLGWWGGGCPESHSHLCPESHSFHPYKVQADLGVRSALTSATNRELQGPLGQSFIQLQLSRGQERGLPSSTAVTKD